MSAINHESKEIDLLELFKIVVDKTTTVIKNSIKGLLFLIGFALKKMHFILLFLLAGAIIGLILFSTSPRYYSSDLIAQPNGISAIDMVDYIGDLSDLCKKNNIQGLAYSLNLPDSSVLLIKNIEAFHYIDVNGDNSGDFIDFNKTFDPRDTTKKIDNLRIYIQVDVYENRAFEKVRNGLFSYIASNPYLLKLNHLRKTELKELISQTEIEISKIDSLQNTEYFKKNDTYKSSKENNLMFLSETEKKLYYHDKLNLIKQKQEYIKELELATAPITIIKDFTHLVAEENPKGKYVIKFGVLFGTLGFIFLITLANRKKIIKFYEFEYSKI